MTVAGTNGITEDIITCWKCGCRSNRFPLCPKTDYKGLKGMQFMLMQGIHLPFSGQFTHPSWILIDDGYNLNSIWNHQLSRNMCPCSTMQSLSNGGTLEYTQCKSLDILPNLKLYYNPQSTANLISMSVVISRYFVTMDSGVKDVIVVHLENNQEIKNHSLRPWTLLLW